MRDPTILEIFSVWILKNASLLITKNAFKKSSEFQDENEHNLRFTSRIYLTPTLINILMNFKSILFVLLPNR